MSTFVSEEEEEEDEEQEQEQEEQEDQEQEEYEPVFTGRLTPEVWHVEEVEQDGGWIAC